MIGTTKKNQVLVDEIDHYLKQLFPINRSITGPGNRETLHILQEIVPLEIKEYPSGATVYDWVIPDEWQVLDAWIKDSDGNKLVDFHLNNIHLVSYSEQVNKKMNFEELRSHLHYSEELPEAIPYRTSYYKRDWGFCVTQAQYDLLQEAEGLMEVYIDSVLDSEGSMSIGELLIHGKSEQEILISTYICHPSLANDNLSGVVMTAFMARELLKRECLKHSYRIIWVPETIGAIAYCAMNEAQMKKIKSGFVVTTVGGPGQFGYKQSFDSNHPINPAIEAVFKDEEIDFIKYPFDIHGSDERQYSSQGFRINTASISKDKYYEYPYYHTSLDNLDFISAKCIQQSLELHLKVLHKMDYERVYRSRYNTCEVMLSKHNLYPEVGGAYLNEVGGYTDLDLILWILFWVNENTTLRSLAHHLGVDFVVLESVAEMLVEKGILEYV
jgi:aminopeptidase-like protein